MLLNTVVYQCNRSQLDRRIGSITTLKQRSDKDRTRDNCYPLPAECASNFSYAPPPTLGCGAQMCRVLSATRNTSESPKMLKPRQRPLECPGGSAARVFELEVPLQRELQLPRRAGTLNAAEIGAVSNVTVRLKELRVVEEIEELGAKLDALTFCNGR